MRNPPQVSLTYENSFEIKLETLTDIGEGAFNRCGNLKQFDIPDRVKRIGKNAFEGWLQIIQRANGMSYPHWRDNCILTIHAKNNGWNRLIPSVVAVKRLLALSCCKKNPVSEETGQGAAICIC